MIVPSLDLKAQYRSIKSELDAKILEVLGSQGFVLGPEVESLERELPTCTAPRTASASLPGPTPCSSRSWPWGSGRGISS